MVERYQAHILANLLKGVSPKEWRIPVILPEQKYVVQSLHHSSCACWTNNDYITIRSSIHGANMLLSNQAMAISDSI